MEAHLSVSRRPRDGRPPPCPVCGCPGWWNGSRVVAQMVLNTVGDILRLVDLLRPRVRCSDRACACGSWTLYEPQGYPHRTFTPTVAASAVAERAVFPKATLTAVAQRCRCDRRTVGRWERWVGGLMEPRALQTLCARLDPSGLPAPAPVLGAGGRARAGHVVQLLEHLAQVLRNQGVALETGSGLAAILRHQFDRCRMVSGLTRVSPPLRVAEGGGGVFI